MDILSSYSVKIKHYNRIFSDTIKLYRHAVEFFIGVCLLEWDALSGIGGNLKQRQFIEAKIHKTKSHPVVPYDFDREFYKFPSYLRRAAITNAIGLVSSYKSNLAKYESHSAGNKAPSIPKAGYSFPAMYRGGCYQRNGDYSAQVKVFRRNTWDWLTVELKKGDVDYILRRCKHRKECAPVLRKCGKEWFLDFTFEEEVKLTDTCLQDRIAVAVDLGLNNACTCSVMKSDGTILDRKFLSLPREQDCLNHAINRIKKAQQHGARRTPRLWAKAKGINDAIAVKTASFIIDIAILWSADVIVFEHLELAGKKKGAKKQRLHHWRAQYVQSMVESKAHRLKMRISRICAWGTSKLAFDGSGTVERGIDGSYSVCKFQTGKIYNCDLSATYNIGARYFIREILKSLSETVRLDIEAKVPQCSRRTTCTFSTLLSLNAALAA